MILDFIKNEKKAKEIILLGHIALLFTSTIAGIAGYGNASDYYYKVAIPEYSFIKLIGQGISAMFNYSINSSVTIVIAVVLLIIPCVIAYSIFKEKDSSIANRLFAIISCDIITALIARRAAVDYKEQISTLLDYHTDLPLSVIDNIKYTQGFVFYFLLINLIFACCVFYDVFYNQEKEANS